MPAGMTNPAEDGRTRFQNNGGLAKPIQRVSPALLTGIFAGSDRQRLK